MSEKMFSALYRLMSQSDNDIEMTDSEFFALQQKIAEGDATAFEQMIIDMEDSFPTNDQQ